MDSPPPSVRRYFLPWDQPLLVRAVNFLAEKWSGQGPLNLSGVLVVVPTRQSGRRLREALAGFAAERGQAVFAPRVVSPEGLISLCAPAGTPSRLESWLAWAAVFRALNLDDFRAVFPVDPPERNFSWAVRLARQFGRLQTTLAEAGLTLGEVQTLGGADLAERERWQQIAALEQSYFAELARLGRGCNSSAGAAAPMGSPLAADFDRIVILATPDPLPEALHVIARHAALMPVEVAIFAPATEAACFDEWGRPLAAAWDKRALPLPDFERGVHLCASPADQASRLAALAGTYSAPEGVLGLGLADPELIPLVESELIRGGQAVFNPEGRPRAQSRLHHLLTACADLGDVPAFERVEALARCPDFLVYLNFRCGQQFSGARFLEALDDLRARRLPPDLAAARKHAAANSRAPELAAGLEAIADLATRLSRDGFASGAASALAEIFSERLLDPATEADADLEQSAAAWTQALDECAAAARSFPELSAREWWELALQLFGETVATRVKPAGALELQGWLELLWEDAPHIAVAGLNDGRVPEAVVGDAFLPESLRVRLGLKTNAARFARDAYLLEALIACRAGTGRVDIFLGKTSTVGDPLRPSRLLFRCADAELPGRITFLFRALEPATTNLAWTRAWPLRPARVMPPRKVAVTGLRAYLQCPLRFYFRHVLRMQSVDAEKNELDARDFGTLCHAALEQLARDPALRACADATILREVLLAEFDRAARARYGDALVLPLLIQLESARQRLARVAEIEAGERAAGWRTEQVEREFTLEIAGVVVAGKIDRIDRHQLTGAVRVLDYKTSDTLALPAAAHLRAPRAGENPPSWARFDGGERPRVWSDLQLPLYLRAVTPEYGPDVSIGYFNLPKAIGATSIELWQNFTPELNCAAQHCAEGACAAIAAGEFWPPNETVRAEYDEFAELFHHGVAESIAGPLRREFVDGTIADEAADSPKGLRGGAMR